MQGLKSVAIVLGTYNRLPCLQRAIASIRASVGAHPYTIIVPDGGSTDGTLDYLMGCYDVTSLEGGLEGAVKAFNKGFARAVDLGVDYVMHLNDDAEIVTAAKDHDYCPVYPIAEAIDVMNEDARIGEVAFAMDLRGGWGFDRINGAPYANFGVIRRDAGMAVAREQGDPDGRAWWNPIYRTYGADTEFGANLWRLGWRVYPARGLRVHDLNHQDALRAANTGNNKNGDGELFWSRWQGVDLSSHVPAEYQVILQRDQRRHPSAKRQVQPSSPRARGRRQPGLNPEYEK